MPANFRSIRFRLPLLFMMVSAIPAVVAIFWISNLLNERMELMLRQRVEDAVQIVDNVFAQYTDDLLLKNRVITQTQRIQELVLKQDRMALINHLNTLNQDLHLSQYGTVVEVFDASGRLLVSEPRKSRQQVPDTMIYTALKRNEFKVSRYFDQQQLRIASALPVFHPTQSSAVGVVALSFDVSHKLVDEIRKITATEVLLFSLRLSETPHLLATTLDESTSEQLIGQFVKGQLALSKRPTYLLAARESDSRNGPFYISAAVETRDMLGVIASMQRILYFVAAAAALLSLIFALGLSRNLINKILYLVRAAQKVEHRDLETQILLESDDELGTLAHNLDNMRLEIKQTLEKQQQMITNLTLRDHLNRAIINLSGTELLKEVLMIVIEAIHAQKGSIMLVDHFQQKLLLKVVYDPVQGLEPVNVLEEISFGFGEGVAGQVALTGEAAICNDTRSDRRFKTYRFQEMDRRIWNMICIPLKVADQVLGVISLDNKTGGFKEEDLTLLQELANQVAIALQNAELYERSITDGLTGLFIRRYFEDLLEQELKRSQRLDSQTALLMFDIDHFKRFNDTYGHQVGDWVIQKVAKVAHNNIRDVDMAARYGGEEFAVIMPETDLEGAWQVAERIRQAVEESFVYHEGHKLTITVSLGCAVFPGQANSKETLIQMADTALYASKHRGRNCATRYSDELIMYEEERA